MNKCETMKISERKTGRQWLEDLRACLMTYTVVGDNGTCPDTFVVAVTCRNEAPSQKTLHRKPGEADYDFWDRTMDVASLLTSQARTKQFNLYQRDYTIEIRCCYGHTIAPTCSDGRNRFEILLWSIADNNQSDEMRVYALGLLAQMYGMYEAS